MNEGLGDAPPVADWAPKTGQDTIDHLASALTRLTSLRGRGGELADQAERAVSTRLRRLLWPDLLEPIRAFIVAVVADRGYWPEAAKSIGDWLYFDRASRDEMFAVEVRRLYDALLPTEPEDRAVLFSQFWPADFRDPEAIYQPGSAVRTTTGPLVKPQPWHRRLPATLRASNGSWRPWRAATFIRRHHLPTPSRLS